MKVLIGFESSGAVRDAFLRRGHDAMSCDLRATESPGPHHVGDIREVLDQRWDLAIFHPPCTYLCRAGIHWNSRGRGYERTEEALELVRFLLDQPIERIALENPIGVIGTRIRKADQVIHPWQFGHDAEKTTLLWTKNLPPLVPTLIVPGRRVMWKGKERERWSNQTDSGNNALPPSKDRWVLRSKTYLGVAEAFAETWGNL